MAYDAPRCYSFVASLWGASVGAEGRMTLSSSSSSAVPAQASRALAIVVMGVAGSGKTTVGERLAAALHGNFIDGDDLHSSEARAKMGAGHALTDEDRWPWLDRIAAALSEGVSRSVTTIVASSALRRAYRDRLRSGVGARLLFVYLEAEPDLMRQRVASRRGHYMPASLVDSQFATLEPPTGEPGVVTLPADADLDAAIPKVTAELTGTRFAS
jgi:gluconokinase